MFCGVVVVSASPKAFAETSLKLGAPYGLVHRATAKAYLGVAEYEGGPVPLRLSQTGAFRDTALLTPANCLIPYGINVSFYSDGATKTRWVSLPPGPGSSVKFSPTGDWRFPAGTVFVKHFEIALDERYPQTRRRLETRLLVCQTNGSVYGLTYKWRADNTDADLLTSNLTETLEIRSASGLRTQTWYYPSRSDCRTCHSSMAGGVLGLKTRQLNCDFAYPGGTIDNQLRAWNHIGLFEPSLDETAIPAYPKLSRTDQTDRTIEERARSYLDANCAYCHRPGGTVAYFDARYDTPLEKQQLINGPVLIDEGLDRAHVISPNDPWRSVALVRISSLEGLKMPPLAHQTLDQRGVELLREWITSLPGPTVLAPPTFSSPGGTQPTPIHLSLAHVDPAATIHYTLDGSSPTKDDPVYSVPIEITGSTTVRARAFRPGFTKSITVQETYVFATQSRETAAGPH